MYLTFIFCYTELTAAIPNAGGPFAYAMRAFGPLGGSIAGFATLIEFLFAPPAIALAIGAYLNVQFPGLDPKAAAVAAYVVFIALNIAGVHIAATFELFVTLLAVAELLVFMGVIAPAFRMSNFVAGGWAGSGHFTPAAIGGMFAALPFAIWFFLAIEGVAMAAEEAREPRAHHPVAYIGGILTLTVLAFGVMIFAGGVGRLDGARQRQRSAAAGDEDAWSAHPAAGCTCWSGWGCSGWSPRSTASSWAMRGRSSRWPAPAICRKVLSPAASALPHAARRDVRGRPGRHRRDLQRQLRQIAGQSLTASIVTVSVFGALVLYIMSMAALFRLRKAEPNLARPFMAPAYPASPAFALAMASVTLVTMVWFNPQLAAIFAATMALAVTGSMIFHRRIPQSVPAV